jgi:NAD(P)-dependent dehydrogenase (short-subunit alcohol dehydrogenase family)
MIGRSLRHFKKLVRVRFSPAAGSPKTASNALLHHMAYFVVTEELRGSLSASAPARIVNTASAAHQGARLDFDDLRLAKSFGPMKAYGRSKLCNILFTRELARGLQGTGVTANCLHPGLR